MLGSTTRRRLSITRCASSSPLRILSAASFAADTASRNSRTSSEALPTGPTSPPSVSSSCEARCRSSLASAINISSSLSVAASDLSSAWARASSATAGLTPAESPRCARCTAPSLSSVSPTFRRIKLTSTSNCPSSCLKPRAWRSSSDARALASWTSPKKRSCRACRPSTSASSALSSACSAARARPTSRCSAATSSKQALRATVSLRAASTAASKSCTRESNAPVSCMPASRANCEDFASSSRVLNNRSCEASWARTATSRAESSAQRVLRSACAR
mmetsp:Transcript_139517/g.446406  ORF Transcript_139517/g.446406 Transcript_139517/m.446406 type:complete len:277 (+) Transcript_139517:1338-2168(+)